MHEHLFKKKYSWKSYDCYMPKIPKWQNIIKVRTVEQINLLNTQYYKAKWLCMYHFATVITLTFTLHAYINISLTLWRFRHKLQSTDLKEDFLPGRVQW